MFDKYTEGQFEVCISKHHNYGRFHSSEYEETASGFVCTQQKFVGTCNNKRHNNNFKVKLW